jgi:hypothetical protein
MGYSYEVSMGDSGDMVWDTYPAGLINSVSDCAVNPLEERFCHCRWYEDGVETRIKRALCAMLSTIHPARVVQVLTNIEVVSTISFPTLILFTGMPQLPATVVLTASQLLHPQLSFSRDR